MNSNLKFFIAKIVFSALFIFFFPNFLFGQKQIISTSILKIESYKNFRGNYNFLVGGHLYGNPSNSTWPASSLLGNIQKFNQLNPLFFISLGDNYRLANEIHINNFINSFINKLEMPFFTVAGNHDVADRKLFNQYFGKSYYDFSINTDHYIILDSEFHNKADQKNQIKYFNDLIKLISKNSHIKNVFVFTHKLLWAEFLQEYEIVLKNSNNTSTYANQRELTNNIFESLNLVKNNKNIYWISGDVGIWRSYQLFYEKDKKENITFIATGLGETGNDMILNIEIKNNSAQINALPLNSLNHVVASENNLIFWEKLFSSQHRSKINFNHLKESLFRLFPKNIILCFYIFLLLMSLALNIVLIKKNKLW